MVRFRKQTNRWQHDAHPVAGWSLAPERAVQLLPFRAGRGFLRGP